MNGTKLGLLVLKILALTLILMTINGIGSRFLPAVDEPTIAEAGTATQVPSGAFLALVVTVMLLQTIALAYPIVRSRWHGWPLAGAVFVLYFGSVTFMSQIESLVYLGGRLPPGMLRGLFLMGLFNAAVFAPVAVLVLRGWRRPEPEAAATERPPQSLSRWLWKIAVGAAVFTALYYLFGYYVAWQNPALRDFYGGSDPGSFIAQMRGIAQGVPWMIPFQYLRGLLWVGLALLVLRMMKGRWWEAGLAVSLLFTVPVAYLFFPNPLMPETVRLSHILETAPYQFLFGWFVVWLLAWRPPSAVGHGGVTAA